MTPRDDSREPASGPSGWLSDIERIGNRLPDPSTLFLLGTLLVMALSQIAVTSGWSVEKQVVEEVRVEVRGPDGAPVLDPVTHQQLTVAVLDPATRQTAARAQTRRGDAGEPARPRGFLLGDR